MFLINSYKRCEEMMTMSDLPTRIAVHCKLYDVNVMAKIDTLVFHPYLEDLEWVLFEENKKGRLEGKRVIRELIKTTCLRRLRIPSSRNFISLRGFCYHQVIYSPISQTLRRLSLHFVDFDAKSFLLFVFAIDYFQTLTRFEL